MGNSRSRRKNKNERDKMTNEATDKLEVTDKIRETDTLVVAAIDFGTTYTGYAFAFRGDRGVTGLRTAKTDRILRDDRVPTTVLLNEDKTLNSFGLDAEQLYCELSISEQKKYYLFKSFKMALFRGERLTRETTISDVRNKEMRAIEIFSLVIEHIKECAVELIKGSHAGLLEPDIDWVITIPAIWTDSARQFMKEAALLAGIQEANLRFVLEPEAASLFAREQVLHFGSGYARTLPVGHKYILADLGGGTADICVHEILDGGNLREIYRATGGELGGTRVEFEFTQFLIKLVGAVVYTRFKEEYTSCYIDLMNEFERKKKLFSSAQEKIVIKLEPALLDILELVEKETLDNIIPRTVYEDKLLYRKQRCQLVISKEVMEQFFNSSVNKIIEKLTKILHECEHDTIETLVLVGGYSESPFVRERIQEKCPIARIVLENDARLAVLKGAVMMGFKPRNIIERRAKYTYGFACAEEFIQGVHPRTLQFAHEGKTFCGLIFKKLIQKGQILKYGQKFTMSTNTPMASQNKKHEILETCLYRSTCESPKYCTEDEDCVLVGKIIRKPTSEGWTSFVATEHHLIVGETELKIKVIDQITGVQYDACLDFL
ncbi:heat shock 70 kDa protein 12A-like [Mercenaria mercenaria]|uniref:heat shock 70 kDa protein 12A-like n=1 Tax=Mercenaria mercenaria TaxID=6596 RepID=UPI00234E3F7A|nr:heat shock 70 kDa protein 12A-like [Mercenaria mercenaria]